MPDLATRHLFDIRIDYHVSEPVGQTPGGTRTITTLTGGEFHGERLHGVVLPTAGTAWALRRGDGNVELDVRLLLQTRDEAQIYFRYTGLISAEKPVMSRLLRGESLPPSEYAMLTTGHLETSSDAYTWLNRIITVGSAELFSDRTEYVVHEVL